MPPQSVWTEKIRIRPYETDLHNLWKPACFFQAMQEAASHHAANLGCGYEDLLKRDRVWLLSRMRIEWESYPSLREEIVIQTWPKGIWQKVFFMRDFIFTTSEGRKLATATSAWLLVNIQTHRLLLPQALDGNLPLNEGLSAMVDNPDKLPAPSSVDGEATFTAGYSAIDLVGHVNNARYIEWICDSQPVDWYRSHSLRLLQVNYNNEVKPDEKVRVTFSWATHPEEDWLVQGLNQTTSQRAFEAALRWAPFQPNEHETNTFTPISA